MSSTAESAAVLQLAGTFTRASQQRLEELLDWLISQGANEIRIELGTTIGIGSECLSVHARRSIVFITGAGS